MTGATLLAVAAGGALGATARYLTVAALRHVVPGFPLGTLAVNVLGSLAMGLLAVAMVERFPASWGRYAPFVMAGFLGAFTTFSAFSLDALVLIERGRIWAATLYIGGSVALSVGALAVGLWAGRSLWGWGA